MITLTNDFHRTSINLRAEEGDTLTPAQYRRVQSTLCGIHGCTCGTVRGTQPYALCREGFDPIIVRVARGY